MLQFKESIKIKDYNPDETNFDLLTLNIKVVISFVSNMYPRGIQFKNLSNVSKVTATSGTFCELSMTNWQS